MNKTQEKWEEIEDASYIAFENIGDTIEGMLTHVGQSKRYGFGIYEIMTKKGELKRFHGSKQLDDLMRNVKDQDYIQVTFIDTQNMPEGQLKVFSVKRKP